MAMYGLCYWTNQRGRGTFGRSVANGGKGTDIQRFHLGNNFGKSASLIHLALAESDDGREVTKLWFLFSSIIAPIAIDFLVEIRFDPDYKAITEPWHLCH